MISRNALSRLGLAVVSAAAISACGATVSPTGPAIKAAIALTLTPSPAPETISAVPCDGTGSRVFGPYQLILRENEGVGVEITDVTYRYIGSGTTSNSQSVAWTKAQIQQRFDSTFLPPRGILQATRTACVGTQGTYSAIEYTISGTDDSGNKLTTTERVPFNTGVVFVGSFPAVVALRIDGQRTLRPGATAQMKAIAILSDGRSVQIPHADVIWSTDDPPVATISALGVLTGGQRGETQLRVRYQGLTDATRVAVELPVDVSGSWSGTFAEGNETWSGTFVLMQAPFKVPHTDYYKVVGTYWYKGNVWCGDLSGRLIDPGEGLTAELDLTIKPVSGCGGSTGRGSLSVDVDVLRGSIGDSEGSVSVFLVRRRRP
jgi:hypothetical protein